MVLVLFAASLAAALGALVAKDLKLTLAPPAVLLAMALLVSAKLRVLAVTVGSMFVLQSSPEFSVLKALYAFVALIAIGGALAALPARHEVVRRAHYGTLLFSSALLGSYLVITLLLSSASGISPLAWLRDAAPLLLLAAGPLFALDAGLRFNHRSLETIFIVCGLGASVSFMVEWLGRRGLTQPLVEMLGFPSYVLAIALFCYAISSVTVRRRGRLMWAAIAVTVLSTMLLTGTRSALVLAVVPVIAGIASGRLARAARRLAMAAPIALVFGAALVLVLATSTGVRLDHVGERLATVVSIASQPSADVSTSERMVEIGVAWDALQDSALAGVGFGEGFAWVQPRTGLPRTSHQLDTSLSLVSRLGVLGGAVLLVFVAAYARLLYWVRRQSNDSAPVTATVTFAVVVLFLSLVGSPIEDKGFAIAFMLLTALCLSGIRRRSDAKPPGSQ